MLEVERGNDVVLVAAFTQQPEGVYFSFVRPSEGRATVDPGYGRQGSKIRYLGTQGDVAKGDLVYLYAYTIDTTGFRGGQVEWHFWGTGGERSSAFDTFKIVDRPAQLL
jgi:hypothetical protein